MGFRAGAVVRDACALALGDPLELQLQRGRLEVEVRARHLDGEVEAEAPE